jgi:hypothetical protein
MRKSENGKALPADLEAIAVMLDLVDPARPGRRLEGARRDAGRDVADGRGHFALIRPFDAADHRWVP